MDAENYFLPESSATNQIRFRIWQLMELYQSLDRAWKEVVNFQLPEEQGKDLVEETIIEMEMHHKQIAKEMQALMEKMNDKDLAEFKETRLGEALRRTDLFLTQLNRLDLDKNTWLTTLSRCVSDIHFHQQIKTLIFHD